MTNTGQIQLDMLMMFAGMVRLGAFAVVIGCIIGLCLATVLTSSVQGFITIAVALGLIFSIHVPVLYVEQETLASFLGTYVFNTSMAIVTIVICLGACFTVVRNGITIFLMLAVMVFMDMFSRLHIGVKKG
ncbi:hypothetical protein CN495_08810 [Bacillus thuringiensis]|uniref:Uncharacterized protein n=1 Tax=Bacillus thuringiensis TaxID=1428 RepID=A0ABD6S7Q6_BACTU|nr:hypothetical protein [Bacillus thuringiensis]PER55841.1 hypothetical protein CN495_08810 [Bacillus thuringiensis]